MRKQWIALLLCLCLLSVSFSSLADVAVRESTQLDKLKGHWMNSSFQGTLTGTATQKGPAFADEVAWSVFRAYLQDYTVSYTHTNQNSTADLGSEDVLTLSNTAGDVSIRNIFVEDPNGIRYIRSPLLDDQGMYYAFDPSNDAVSLLTDAVSENAWPSLAHVVYAIATANEDWQKRAQASYNQFSIKVTGWLQNYAKTVTEADTEGRFVMTNEYEIPAGALLQEAKALLVDLFVDQDLLSLLREILTVDEQAAYLQKDMLWSFLSMIDKVKLNGDISVRRQFSAENGDVIFESMRLPFAETFPLKEATIVHSVQEDGDLWQVRAELAQESYQGALVDISAQSMGSGVWVGDVKWTPAPSKDSVEEAKPLTFAYNLEWTGPEDVNDTYEQRYERNYKGTLVVKADESLNLPVMSLSFTNKIYSKLATLTAPTYLDAVLEWADLESGAGVTLTFSGKTSTRRTPIYMAEAIASALRLDMLSAESRASLLSGFLHNLPARFLQLVNVQQ